MTEYGRRIVTGTANGQSRIVSDGPAPRRMTLDAMGGFAKVALWEAPTPISATTDGGDPTANPLHLQPDPGVMSIEIDVIPPDAASTGADPAAVQTEIKAKYPQLLDALDPDHPGMHRTDTLDFVTVISGRLVLVVDDGETELAPGDTVVNCGTRHAWKNPGDKPCVISTVMLRPRAN